MPSMDNLLQILQKVLLGWVGGTVDSVLDHSRVVSPRIDVALLV